MSTTAKSITEVSTNEKPKTLAQLISSKQVQYKTLLPSHVSPERFMRIVFTQMQKNPTLLKCTPDSVLSSILTAAEMGLMPDGRNGALVPFNKKVGNDWVKEAQFIPMYQGLIGLARNSGEIADIFPATVYENDDYSYELGLNRDLTHRPNLTSDRGKPIAYYCVVELKSGAKTFGAGPMTVKEIESIKDRAKAKNGPWVTDFESMAWKTVIKRVLKLCPQSPELERAIEIDNDFSLDDDVIDIAAIEEQASENEELNNVIGKIADEKKSNPDKVAAKAKPKKEPEPADAEPEVKQTDNPNKVTLTRIARMLKDAKTDDDIDVALDLSNNIENPVHKKQAVEMAVNRLTELSEVE